VDLKRKQKVSKSTHLLSNSHPPLDQSLKVSLSENFQILQVGLDVSGGVLRLQPTVMRRKSETQSQLDASTSLSTPRQRRDLE